MKGKGRPENSRCNYCGVRREYGNWVAEIRQPNDRGSKLCLGTNPTAIQASLAYDEVAKVMFGPRDCVSLHTSEWSTDTLCSESTSSAFFQVSGADMKLKLEDREQEFQIADQSKLLSSSISLRMRCLRWRSYLALWTTMICWHLYMTIY